MAAFTSLKRLNIMAKQKFPLFSLSTYINLYSTKENVDKLRNKIGKNNIPILDFINTVA